MVTPARMCALAQAAVEQRRGGGEFDAVVDAEHAAIIGRERRVTTRSPPAAKLRDRVGQVVFALRVVVAQARRLRRATSFRRRRRGPRSSRRVRVRRPSRRAPRRSWPRAPPRAHDAPEGTRQRHPRRDERERVLACAIERVRISRFDERHVAVEHEQRALVPARAGERHLHGVARAELRLLQHGATVRVARVAGDGLDVRSISPFVTTLRRARPRRAARARRARAWAAAQLVQHLGRALFMRVPLPAASTTARTPRLTRRRSLHRFPARGTASSLRHASLSAFVAPPSRSSATRKRSRTRSRPRSAIESNSGTDCALPVTATYSGPHRVAQLRARNLGDAPHRRLDRRHLPLGQRVERGEHEHERACASRPSSLPRGASGSTSSRPAKKERRKRPEIGEALDPLREPAAGSLEVAVANAQSRTRAIESGTSSVSRR
jgi:hypothetical protein